MGLTSTHRPTEFPGAPKKDRDGVEAEIATIVRPRWVSRVITTTLSGDRPAAFRLTFSEDARARRMLTEMDPTQERLYDLFGLADHAPTR